MTREDSAPVHLNESTTLAVTFLLFLFASLAFYSLLILPLSWTVFSEDDSHIMRVAIDHGWFEHYFVPDVYRQLSVANYTPLSLTLYRFMLLVAGLNPVAYLVFSVIAISLVSALAGLLTEQLAKSRIAAWMAMLLIFSNTSMLTLLSRFYTIHYIAGAIFTLLALVLIVRGRSVLPAVLIFFALISKEVYVVLPFLIVVYAIYHRNYRLGLSVAAALVGYLGLRTYILGFSFDVGSSNSYFAGFWGIALEDWWHFIVWYIKSRYLILTGVLVALVLSPRRMLLLLPIALAFALPSLSVSHGILQPEMHADRLFFALDIGLVMVAVIAMHAQVQRYMKVGYLIPLAVLLPVIHLINQDAYREREESGTDYKITNYLLDNLESLDAMTIYVPLDFIQGDLMRVSESLGGPSFHLTQNCIIALDSEGDGLLVFDDQGDLTTRDALQATCGAADPEVIVDIAPRFSNGILEWSMQVSAGYAAGILFVDRALAVPATTFARQLVMPAAGERYQAYAVRNGQWWFSEMAVVEIRD